MSKVIEIDPPYNQTTIQAMRRDGPSRLQVLADFDRTLTRAFVNGRRVPALVAILRDGDYLSPKYKSEAQALYEKYHPIEINPNIPPADKKSAMRDWWSAHFKLMKKYGLLYDDFKRAMASETVQLRDGANMFFSLLNQYHIPLIIMSSSGIGYDSIKLFLKYRKLFTSNIYIISNRIEWDKHGRFIGVDGPIIHSMNKDETVLKNFPVYQQIKNRANVLLLGDTTGDADMIIGFDYAHLLKIGFLNENIKQSLASYQHCFDLIITDDGPLTAVNKIITTIINR